VTLRSAAGAKEGRLKDPGHTVAAVAAGVKYADTTAPPREAIRSVVLVGRRSPGPKGAGMIYVLLLSASLFSVDSNATSSELAFTIERDHGSSSDHVTLCRVKVVNYGSRSWSGRAIAFEARAIRDGAVAATERGKFGLTLLPYSSLETMIGFTGRFDRFEVSPVGRSSSEGRARGGKSGRRKSRAGSAG
jgi:hypothetical protein